MATEISLGDGRKTNFWHDRWLCGQCPKIIALSLFRISTRKNRTVQEAVREDTWLSGLAIGLTDEMLSELSRLAILLDDVVLREGQPDTIAWRFTSSHEYSARSAYLLQFEGAIQMKGYNLIWKAWAPGKCRFFLWTSMLGKILTADVLLRRGWENNYFCPLCERSLETAPHLLIECPWSRFSWQKIAALSSIPALLPDSWDGRASVQDGLSG